MNIPPILRIIGNFLIRLIAFIFLAGVAVYFFLGVDFHEWFEAIGLFAKLIVAIGLFAIVLVSIQIILNKIIGKENAPEVGVLFGILFLVVILAATIYGILHGF